MIHIFSKFLFFKSSFAEVFDEPPFAFWLEKSFYADAARENPFIFQIRNRSMAPREILTGQVKPVHPVQFKKTEILAGKAPSPYIPAGPAEDKIIRLNGPAAVTVW